MDLQKVKQLTERPKKDSVLTHDHKQVLWLLAQGLEASQAADVLGCSVSTVNARKMSAMRILGAKGTANAVFLASIGGHIGLECPNEQPSSDNQPQ